MAGFHEIITLRSFHCYLILFERLKRDNFFDFGVSFVVVVTWTFLIDAIDLES